MWGSREIFPAAETCFKLCFAKSNSVLGQESGQLDSKQLSTHVSLGDSIPLNLILFVYKMKKVGLQLVHGIRFSS